jgi:hypothetical protein
MSFSVAFVVAPIAGTRVLEHLGGAALWYGIGALGPLLGLGGYLLSPAFRTRETSARIGQGDEVIGGNESMSERGGSA